MYFVQCTLVFTEDRIVWGTEFVLQTVPYSVCPIGQALEIHKNKY